MPPKDLTQVFLDRARRAIERAREGRMVMRFIEQLERPGCRYEVSGKTRIRPEDPDFRFCDLPTEPGTSWCEEHHKIVYVKEKQ